MKEEKKAHKKKNSFAVVDILRGRVPQFDNPFLFMFVFIVVVLFWTLIIFKLGPWMLSLPGISNLVDLIRQNRSP